MHGFSNNTSESELTYSLKIRPWICNENIRVQISFLKVMYVPLLSF